MNKEKLFAYLEKLPSSELINILDDCYSSMKSRDIRNVFWHYEDKFLSASKSDGETILKSVRKFMEDSLNGVYYAPFDINSKNFMDVPEETDLWFEKLAEFLQASRYFRNAHKSIHVYAHENDATTISPSPSCGCGTPQRLYGNRRCLLRPVNACLLGAPRLHASID